MSSTDYNYDEQVRKEPPLTWVIRKLNLSFIQGQFFPYFILTLTGLVTLPLTYNLLRPSKGERVTSVWHSNAQEDWDLTLPCLDLENTAPRIKSTFHPEHEAIIDAQKRKRLRKERRIKRIVTVIVGYAIMAWMIYLMIVTARTIPKLWDPYEILGISRVSCRGENRVYTRLSMLN